MLLLSILLACGGPAADKPTPSDDAPVDDTAGGPAPLDAVRAWLDEDFADQDALREALLQVAEDMERELEGAGDRRRRTDDDDHVAALFHLAQGNASLYYGELRARLLDDPDRARRWATLSAQSSGHVAHDLGPLCGVRAPTTQGTCPDPRPLSVFFVNGIATDPNEAVLNTCMLAARTDDLHRSCCPDREVSYTLAYNQTDGAVLDLLESFLQRGGPFGVVGDAWRWLCGLLPSPLEEALLGLPELVQQIVDLLADAVRRLNPLDGLTLGAHVDAYREALSGGDRVVIYAHSQGNLFANAAWASLGGPSPDDLSIVAIAAPTGEVAGGSEADHVTLASDRVVAGVDALFDVMDGNVVNEDASGEDTLHHNLIASYLGVRACGTACEAIRAVVRRQLGQIGDAGLCAWAALPEAAGYLPGFVGLGDFTGDGRADLLVGRSAADQVGLVLAGGDDFNGDDAPAATISLSPELTAPYEQCFQQPHPAWDRPGQGGLLLRVDCVTPPVLSFPEVLTSGSVPGRVCSCDEVERCGSTLCPGRSCACSFHTTLRLPPGLRGTLTEADAVAELAEAWEVRDGLVIDQAGSGHGLAALPLAGDFDGDGTHDLGVLDAYQGVAWVVPATLEGDMLQSQRASAVLDAGGLRAVGDLDGDGLVELAISDDRGWHILPGGSSGSLGPEDADVTLVDDILPGRNPVPGWPRQDIDGDGKDDLVATTSRTADGLRFWFGPLPRGDLSRDTASVVFLERPSTLSVVGDVTGDDRDDVAGAETLRLPHEDGLLPYATTLILWTDAGEGGTRDNASGLSFTHRVACPDLGSGSHATVMAGAIRVGDVTAGPAEDLAMPVLAYCNGPDGPVEPAEPFNGLLLFAP